MRSITVWLGSFSSSNPGFPLRLIDYKAIALRHALMIRLIASSFNPAFERSTKTKLGFSLIKEHRSLTVCKFWGVSVNFSPCSAYFLFCICCCYSSSTAFHSIVKCVKVLFSTNAPKNCPNPEELASHQLKSSSFSVWDSETYRVSSCKCVSVMLHFTRAKVYS